MPSGPVGGGPKRGPFGFGVGSLNILLNSPARSIFRSKNRHWLPNNAKIHLRDPLQTTGNKQNAAFLYGFEPVGREFESLRAHHKINHLQVTKSTLQGPRDRTENGIKCKGAKALPTIACRLASLKCAVTRHAPQVSSPYERRRQSARGLSRKMKGRTHDRFALSVTEGLRPAKFHEKLMPKVGYASACQPAGVAGVFRPVNAAPL